MQKFLIAYHGGSKPSTKEEGMALMNNWKLWIESLGDQVINSGTPLIETKIISVDGIFEERDSNQMNGFAVLKAENIESALEIAQSDPFLKTNGTIKLSKMVEMF